MLRYQDSFSETAVWDDAGRQERAPRTRHTAPFGSRVQAAADQTAAVHDERAVAGRPAPIDRHDQLLRIVQPIEEPQLDDGAAFARQLEVRPLLIEAPLLIRIHNVERVSPDPRLWLITRPGSAMAEQYRVLSLKLKEAPALRVISLAGPTDESDGALAAANVALALGEGTRSRVLLIDADLRRPRIGALFGVPDSPGLSEQVRHHRRQPGEAWEVAGISGTVSVLTSGAVEKNPAAVLSSESLGELMQEARRAFDYIIVSAPPMLRSADVNILQDHLDGAILLVKMGVTRRDSVQAAVDRVGAGRFIGTVMLEV